MLRRRQPGSRPTRSTRSRCRDARQDGAAGRLESRGCWRTTASTTWTPRCYQVQENKFYADGAAPRPPSSGCGCTRSWTAVAVEPGGRFETDAHARPAGRAGGWEYLTGTGWDWDAELAELPELLAEKLAAPRVEAGPLRPGHRPVEPVADHPRVDRPRHRAGPGARLRGGYAGTSFATFDKLGTLQYGSPVMNVTGDRTAEHGLATIGYDDEGVATQSWDLITGGVLVGYQLDRRIAQLTGPRPVQRLRVRRLPRPHADPADGQRLAAAGRGRPVAPRS